MTNKVALFAVSAVCLAVGITAGTQISAQGTPAAVAIVEIDVKDEDAFMKSGYGPKVGKIMTDGGGTYLARGGKVHPIEGNVSKRVAIVRFDSVEKARGVFQSDVYRENRKPIESIATFRVYLAEVTN